jgi:hypothetical protein
MKSTKNTKHTCILITGPGHSATRLLINMLDKHPDVCVPMNALNAVSEFTPLHQLFIQSMDQTPLSSTQYAVHKQDLFLVIDAYMANVDTNKKRYSVLKMPYYPLNCLQLFNEYFDSRLILLYTNRPVEKTVQSYVKRGEDKLFFVKQPIEILRQIKKLGLEERVKVLASLSAIECFRGVDQRCEYLRDQWNKQHPGATFITVDVEKLAASKEYVCDLLEKMHLPQNGIDEMVSVIDRRRLLSKGYRIASLKRIIIRMIPQIMVDLLKKFIRR